MTVVSTARTIAYRLLGPGRVYRMPQSVVATLERVFGAPVDSIRVIEHSRYARAHRGMSATTRRDRILLSGSGDEFVADHEFLLHEYFHVLRQWNTGALTRSGYLIESFRYGYRDNRFEKEARDFAARTLRTYATKLRECA